MALMIGAAVFAPALTRYDPEEMDMENRLAGPSAQHVLGTDNFGRDLWTRMAFGARVSLAIALVSVTVAAVVGTLVGLAAGYYGGWVDMLLMRVVDLFLGFPPIVLALALVAALGPGATNVAVALIAVFWTQYARVVRSATLVEVSQGFVAAAKAGGLPSLTLPPPMFTRQTFQTTALPEAAATLPGCFGRPPESVYVLDVGGDGVQDGPSSREHLFVHHGGTVAEPGIGQGASVSVGWDQVQLEPHGVPGCQEPAQRRARLLPPAVLVHFRRVDADQPDLGGAVAVEGVAIRDAGHDARAR